MTVCERCCDRWLGRTESNISLPNVSPNVFTPPPRHDRTVRSRLPRLSTGVVKNNKLAAPDDWPQRDGWEWWSELGKGAYGVVYACKDGAKNKRVAVKKLELLFNQGYEDCRRTLREIAILARLDSESVIKIHEIIIPGDVATFQNLYIVLEMCDFDLRKLIYDRENRLTREQSSTLCYNLLVGVNYIHSAGVYHRDLKPANVLVNANHDVKICDFNLARALGAGDNDLETMEAERMGEAHAPPALVRDESDHLPEVAEESRCIHVPIVLERTRTPHVVTRYYRAPELMLYQKNYHYTAAIDIWSVGCIYAELLWKQNYAELLRKQDKCQCDPILFPGGRSNGLSPPSANNGNATEQLDLIFKIIGIPSYEDIEAVGKMVMIKDKDKDVEYERRNAIAVARDNVNACRENLKRSLEKEYPRKSSSDMDLLLTKGSGLADKVGTASLQEINFLTRTLTFRPDRRIKAGQALRLEVFDPVRLEALETVASSRMVLEFESDRDNDISKLRKYLHQESKRLRPYHDEC